MRLNHAVLDDALDGVAEGNRLRLTLALPEPKAALTSLFAAPKPPPTAARPETGKEEAGKESDAPVAPRRPPG